MISLRSIALIFAWALPAAAASVDSVPPVSAPLVLERSAKPRAAPVKPKAAPKPRLLRPVKRRGEVGPRVKTAKAFKPPKLKAAKLKFGEKSSATKATLTVLGAAGDKKNKTTFASEKVLSKKTKEPGRAAKAPKAVKQASPESAGLVAAAKGGKRSSGAKPSKGQSTGAEPAENAGESARSGAKKEKSAGSRDVAKRGGKHGDDLGGGGGGGGGKSGGKGGGAKFSGGGGGGGKKPGGGGGGKKKGEKTGDSGRDGEDSPKSGKSKGGKGGGGAKEKGKKDGAGKAKGRKPPRLWTSGVPAPLKLVGGKLPIPPAASGLSDGYRWSIEERVPPKIEFDKKLYAYEKVKLGVCLKREGDAETTCVHEKGKIVVVVAGLHRSAELFENIAEPRFVRRLVDQVEKVSFGEASIVLSLKEDGEKRFNSSGAPLP